MILRLLEKVHPSPRWEKVNSFDCYALVVKELDNDL